MLPRVRHLGRGFVERSGRCLEFLPGIRGAEVIDMTLMNSGFRCHCFYLHPTDRIDIDRWRCRARSRGGRFTVLVAMMAVPHHMGATAEPHHEKKQSRP